MNIVVCVKQVPDTWAEKKLDTSDKTTDRANVDSVMNEIDEYAVEEALRIKEAHGGEVTIVDHGPEKAVETIRKALSMGADKAVHLTDEALHGSCAIADLRRARRRSSAPSSTTSSSSAPRPPTPAASS